MKPIIGRAHAIPTVNDPLFVTLDKISANEYYSIKGSPVHIQAFTHYVRNLGAEGTHDPTHEAGIVEPEGNPIPNSAGSL